MSEHPNQAPERDAIEQILQTGTFETSLEALETVVAHLERGLLPIDEAVHWYELGLGLARRCSDLLRNAELRISDLEESYGLTRQNDDAWESDGF